MYGGVAHVQVLQYFKFFRIRDLHFGRTSSVPPGPIAVVLAVTGAALFLFQRIHLISVRSRTSRCRSAARRRSHSNPRMRRHGSCINILIRSSPLQFLPVCCQALSSPGLGTRTRDANPSWRFLLAPTIDIGLPVQFTLKHIKLAGGRVDSTSAHIPSIPFPALVTSPVLVGSLRSMLAQFSFAREISYQEIYGAYPRA